MLTPLFEGLGSMNLCLALTQVVLMVALCSPFTL